MTKSKTEKHKVEYKGRFLLNKDQVNPETAHKLLIKCSKLRKRNLVKTTMKLHESGFHIGHVSGLVNIRKLWFYFKDLRHYFVFGTNPNAVVIVSYVKEKYYMSYFCFINEDSLSRITNAIDNITPSGHDNPDFIDETDGPIEHQEVMITDDVHTDDECNVASFLENIDEDICEPIHEEPIEIRQSDTTEKIFFKYNSRINNLFHSSYADLFNETDNLKTQTNYDNSNEFYEDQLTEVIDGSMFLFSENFVVPVVEIFGVCESDDEDV